MNKLLAALSAALCLAAVPCLHGADTRTELQTIVNRINTKLHTSTRGEVDVTDDVKALDALRAAHKGEQTPAAEDLLNFRIEVDLDLLRDYNRAATDVRAIQQEFPASDYAKRANFMLPEIDRLANAQRIEKSLAVGTQFPDFQATDLNGQPLSISAYKGKVVLIDFWATWCPPCVQDFPTLTGLYSQYRDHGFQLVGVSLDQDKDKLTGFLKARQATWPEYFDGQKETNKLAVAYGVIQTPTNYLLNREGKIIAKNLRGEGLAAAVQAAVAVN